MTDWTKEEDEAFNAVEQQCNLGKQILRSQGQPYHWQLEAINAAIRMEREACAKICDDYVGYGTRDKFAAAIRARNNT